MGGSRHRGLSEDISSWQSRRRLIEALQVGFLQIQEEVCDIGMLNMLMMGPG